MIKNVLMLTMLMWPVALQAMDYTKVCVKIPNEVWLDNEFQQLRNAGNHGILDLVEWAGTVKEFAGRRVTSDDVIKTINNHVGDYCNALYEKEECAPIYKLKAQYAQKNRLLIMRVLLRDHLRCNDDLFNLLLKKGLLA